MIKIKDICVGYNGNAILNNISADFCSNSFTYIIGVNGSGKSTFLKAMAGLIPLISGEILCNNLELKSLSHKERARMIAYLPQGRLVPDIEAITLIEHGRYPYLGFSKNLTNSDKKIVEEAIHFTDTHHLMNRKLPQLSGGERQRVYLAMAIAQDAQIILLDEPTTYLDINYQLEILDIIEKLHKQGKTIIMVAHDLPQAFTYAEKICVIDNGQILRYDSPEVICQSQCLADVFGVSVEKASDHSNSIYKYSILKKTVKD